MKLYRILFFIVLANSFLYKVEAQFNHPGLSLSKTELDYIKSKVNSNSEPNKSGWDKMMSQHYHHLSHQHKATDSVYADGGVSGGLSEDVLAALSHAYQWWIKGNQANADKSIEILNAWADTLLLIDNKPGEYYRQEVLVAGWHAQPLCEAAEIIRYSNAGWDSLAIKKFEDMLLRVFYPLIKENSPENGNWEASQINSLIAIFCNDTAIFNRGISFYKGTGKGSIRKYIYDSGESQETCRDMGHTQMGLGELVDAAEIALHQSVDLYSLYPDSVTGLPRLAMGLEHAAKILNGIPQSTRCGLLSKPNYSVSPIWEKAWNHFGNRMKLKVPYIEMMKNRSRAEGVSWKAMYSWGTLTHAQLNIDSSYIKKGLVTSEILNLINPKQKIKVGPNPTNNYILLMPKYKGYVYLYDMFGNLVNHYNNTVHIDLSKFKPGIYSLRVNDQAFKIVKE